MQKATYSVANSNTVLCAASSGKKELDTRSSELIFRAERNQATTFAQENMTVHSL